MCNNGNGSGIAEILEKIILLQRFDVNTQAGCTKPILGEISGINANTRPINIYTCCNGTIWSMPYGDAEESTVFRIESINENCATFRILESTEAGYTATNSYFTINLNCVSCITCLDDTLVTNL